MNDAEQEFALWATGEGWTVTKRGWPDFLCFREDEVMAVEVKWSDDSMSGSMSRLPADVG